SFCISARAGAPSPAMTEAGSETARATTSRTDLWVGSRLTAARQSAMKRSRSNTVFVPLSVTQLLVRRLQSDAPFDGNNWLDRIRAPDRHSPAADNGLDFRRARRSARTQLR